MNGINDIVDGIIFRRTLVLYNVQRDGAFAGTPVADTDRIGIRHTKSFPSIGVNAEIQTEQVSDKKILRTGVLRKHYSAFLNSALLSYEDVDDAGKGEGILHG